MSVDNHVEAPKAAEEVLSDSVDGKVSADFVDDDDDDDTEQVVDVSSDLRDAPNPMDLLRRRNKSTRFVLQHSQI